MERERENEAREELINPMLGDAHHEVKWHTMTKHVLSMPISTSCLDDNFYRAMNHVTFFDPNSVLNCPHCVYQPDVDCMSEAMKLSIGLQDIRALPFLYGHYKAEANLPTDV